MSNPASAAAQSLNPTVGGGGEGPGCGLTLRLGGGGGASVGWRFSIYIYIVMHTNDHIINYIEYNYI